MVRGQALRITKNWEFRRVYRQGKVLVSERIVIYYFRNRYPYNRLGFSISKKTGNSVQRHRIKRIYRESFRSIKESLKSGYDLVLIARKPATEATFQSAREEWLYLCQKGKLLKES